MILVDENLCKGCNICIYICPTRVLESSNKLNKMGYIPPFPAREDKCVRCRLCELICPDLAIRLVEE
ncbi:MAG TPA: 4Fe-4S dicluster domain-containing protein [Thermoplasmatales archaeon]|nr:4Fe-4S dicluster domain-containing protein [Thermoplasmatales archaeon]